MFFFGCIRDLPGETKTGISKLKKKKTRAIKQMTTRVVYKKWFNKIRLYKYAILTTISCTFYIDKCENYEVISIDRT